MTRVLDEKQMLLDERSVMRARVAELAEALIDLYRQTGAERHRLSQERGKVDGGVLHGEIELFVNDVEGYATSIADRGKVREPVRAVRVLLGMNGARLLAALNRCDGRYPKLKRYVRDADDLRRLAIEFLERYAG